MFGAVARHPAPVSGTALVSLGAAEASEMVVQGSQQARRGFFYSGLRQGDPRSEGGPLCLGRSRPISPSTRPLETSDRGLRALFGLSR